MTAIYAVVSVGVGNRSAAGSGPCLDNEIGFSNNVASYTFEGREMQPELSEHRPEGLVKIANTLLEKQMNESVRGIFPELTGPQFVIVYYLYEHDGLEVTQKAVSDRFRLSHPTVRGIVKRLVKAGWIIAEPQADDRRQMVLILTDRARADLTSHRTEVRHALQATGELALNGFSNQESRQLVNYLERIIGNLES